MAPTKNQSESMKNKGKMWGGDKATSTSGSKKSASGKSATSATKSNTTKSSSSSSSKTATMAKGGKKTMNSKTEFAQDMCALNDVEIVSDVLNSQKGLVKLYGTALCETSCENMRTLVGKHLTECGDDQYDVFLYMNERNLYPIEDAPGQKLTKAKDKFKGYEKHMKK